MRRLLPLLALAGCAPEGGVAATTQPAAPPPAPAVVKMFAPAEPLRLVGREPTWIGRVARDGLSVGGMTPGRVRTPWVEPVVSGGALRWRTQTSDGPLEITLTPEACSDGTDQRYTFKAVLVLGNRTLNGCAAPETAFTWVE